MHKKELEDNTIKYFIEDIGWANVNVIEIQPYNNYWRIVVEAYEYSNSRKVNIFYSIIVSERFHIVSINRI